MLGSGEESEKCTSACSSSSQEGSFQSSVGTGNKPVSLVLALVLVLLTL